MLLLVVFFAGLFIILDRRNAAIINLLTPNGSKTLETGSILTDISIKDIEAESDYKLAEAIKRARENKLVISPGFDGEYGKVKIFADDETVTRNISLF